MDSTPSISFFDFLFQRVHLLDFVAEHLLIDFDHNFRFIS